MEPATTVLLPPEGGGDRTLSTTGVTGPCRENGSVVDQGTVHAARGPYVFGASATSETLALTFEATGYHVPITLQNGHIECLALVGLGTLLFDGFLSAPFPADLAFATSDTAKTVDLGNDFSATVTRLPK